MPLTGQHIVLGCSATARHKAIMRSSLLVLLMMFGKLKTVGEVIGVNLATLGLLLAILAQSVTTLVR